MQFKTRTGNELHAFLIDNNDPLCGNEKQVTPTLEGGVNGFIRLQQRGFRTQSGGQFDRVLHMSIVEKSKQFGHAPGRRGLVGFGIGERGLAIRAPDDEVRDVALDCENIGFSCA